jgi:fucose permease
LFVLAAMLFGVNMAFTQQYRYAAVENVSAQHVPRAVSLVLAGSIGAAFAGRELVTRGQFWMPDVPFAGTLLVLAVMFLIQALLFLSMHATHSQQVSQGDEAQRSLGQIVRQPLFIVAVLGGTVGFGLMTLIMTATPLSMHINDGYSLEQTADVIKAHVLGMYVPSLVTGFLIEKFGVTRIMFIGAIGLASVSINGLQGHSVLHYLWALIALGVGWNFLYIGGTTLLTYSYNESERFRAQAVNEFSVFGISATASLLAGTVMHYFGWNTLMLIPVPVLLLVAVALIAVRNDPMLQREESTNA